MEYAITTNVCPGFIFIESNGFNTHLSVVSPVLFVAALASGLWYYQFRKPDLLLLTAALFAAIMVIMACVMRYMRGDFDNLLILAMLLIVQVAGAAYWLKGVSRRWEATA